MRPRARTHFALRVSERRRLGSATPGRPRARRPPPPGCAARRARSDISAGPSARIAASRRIRSGRLGGIPRPDRPTSRTGAGPWRAW